ncbi:MAG TPA: type III-A CRISPR-associated protein Cas10/Csm1 [Flavilitoribacter sp.]|nr:type III-A CRISPR-associated protein Cas10/Csm1 [Flavilitoribacter sp.]HMQ89044.1 type III-A CRISPR-associated protein Cas10/Csm1 [Flavilitoribacter sp.]
MDKIKQKIILAALLHDIGKFWQRADEYLDHPNSAIPEKKADWSWLVPYTNEGRPSHQHAIWTYYFFRTYRQKFDDLGLWSEEEDSLLNLAGKHHRPQSPVQAIITMADRWSSAIDRRQPTDEEKGDAETVKSIIDWGNYAYRSIPLHSVFNAVSLQNSGSANDKPLFAYGLNPLVPEKEIIQPYLLDAGKVNEIKKQTLRQEYAELWRKFNHEFKKLPTGSFNGFLNSLLALLKKYTWCIPSSTIDKPDVSLFEHLKTTAGLASSLYDYIHHFYPEFLEGRNGELSIPPGKDPVLLCCCDLSGIQRFIYDIASSKAFKSLKGRSFYLQHLINGVVDYALTKNRQTKANLIYSSGGKAYFVLPNTPRAKDIFDVIRASFEQQLWEEHRGVLYLAFSQVSFRYNTVKEGNKFKLVIESNDTGLREPITELGHLWREVSDRASQFKRKKFGQVFIEKFDALFGNDYNPVRTGIEENWTTESKICAVTGETIPPGKETDIGRDDSIWVFEHVARQVELGQHLKKTSRIFQVNLGTEPPPRIRSASVVIPFLDSGLHSYLFGHERDLGRDLNALPEGTLSLFNSSDFLPDGAEKSKSGFDFQFYGGNEQPIWVENDSERARTLEELCLLGDQNAAFSKLGVLRMDVDNLGKVFIRGLPEENKSFAAYATLSGQLDLFFSGYINTIRRADAFKDHVMIVYSGGDDLFAVGRWDKVLEFGAAVQRDFLEFTGNHPDIGISAGLAIVDRKFPIYKAAEMAGEAEKQAKGFSDPKFGAKNAVTFFGQTVSWRTEFGEAARLKNQLSAFCRSRGMSKSLLQQIQRYYALHRHNRVLKAKGEEPDLSYKWHQAYYLKRFSEREKDQEVKEFVMGLSRKLLHHPEFGSDRYLELAALAARWAEYELKDFVNDKNHYNGG